MTAVYLARIQPNPTPTPAQRQHGTTALFSSDLDRCISIRSSIDDDLTYLETVYLTRLALHHWLFGPVGVVGLTELCSSVGAPRGGASGRDGGQAHHLRHAAGGAVVHRGRSVDGPLAGVLHLQEKDGPARTRGQLLDAAL